jgi:hypothetical protein
VLSFSNGSGTFTLTFEGNTWSHHQVTPVGVVDDWAGDLERGGGS